MSEGHLQEVQLFKARYSSWLVGNSVVSDGGLYLCTPLDPLYILLPALERRAIKGTGRGMYTPLEDLLMDEQYPHIMEMLAVAREQLPLICDVQDVGEEKYLRLNEDKVLAWLLCKLDQAEAALDQQGAGVPHMEVDMRRAYVLGMMKEYLSNEWHQRLVDHLNIQPVGLPGVEPTDPTPVNGTESQLPEKKLKVDPKEAAKKKAAEARAEAKAEKLAKQASGSKKISSFFAKPSAK